MNLEMMRAEREVMVGRSKAAQVGVALHCIPWLLRCLQYTRRYCYMSTALVYHARACVSVQDNGQF